MTAFFRALLGLAAAALLAAPSAAQSDAPPLRLALIIANAAYADAIGPLRNPVRDAERVGAALEAHGYAVTTATDLRTRGDILDAVEQHALRLAEGGATADGIVYYAGHGAAPEGSRENYLLPVGLERPSRTMFRNSATVGEVRAILRDVAPDAAHLFIVDACREELRLPRRFADDRRVQQSRTFTLDQRQTDGDVMIVYSTQPGDLAWDGDAETGGSPFAIGFSEALTAARDGGASLLASQIVRQTGEAMRQANLTQRPVISLPGFGREIRFGRGGDAQCALMLQGALDTTDGVTPQTLEIFRQACGRHPLFARLEARLSGGSGGRSEGAAPPPADVLASLPPLTGDNARRRDACARGDAAACSDLGFSFETGRDVTRDDARAVALYRRACDGGSAHGCTYLGSMYDGGRGGLTRDRAHAAALFRRGCDGDSARGCFFLGLVYYAARDDARAVALFRQGCDGGEAFACSLAGMMYDLGNRVTRDRARAAALFRRACDGGDAGGCLRLASYLMVGLGGLSVDLDEAARLVDRARSLNPN